VKCDLKNISSLGVSFVMLASVTVPSLGMAFGAQSMAAGIVVVIMMSVFLSLSSYLRPIAIQNLVMVFFIINTLLLIVLLSGVQSFFTNNTFNDDRFVQTFSFLLLFIFGVFSWVLLSTKVTSCQADFSVKFVFYVLLLSGFVSLTGFSPFFSDARKPVLLFAEPSHFAVSIAPFLLYMAVTSQSRVKNVLLLLTIILALLQQSLTLLVSVLIVSVFSLRLHKLLFGFLIGAGFLVLGHESIDVDYYISRLNFTEDNDNLTALVFMSGWERAYLNTIGSHGLGVGFQQLGFVGERGVMMEKLAVLGVGYLNLKDGGNVATKLISEFGIFAIMGLFVYLIYFVRFAKWLRGVSLQNIFAACPKKVFFVSCFVMYFIEFFLRGTGYFTSGGFLFLVSIIWLLVSKPNLNVVMR